MVSDIYNYFWVNYQCIWGIDKDSVDSVDLYNVLLFEWMNGWLFLSLVLCAARARSVSTNGRESLFVATLKRNHDKERGKFDFEPVSWEQLWFWNNLRTLNPKIEEFTALDSFYIKKLNNIKYTGVFIGKKYCKDSIT